MRAIVVRNFGATPELADMPVPEPGVGAVRVQLEAAGVPEIAVVVPPTPFGGYNDDLLAACHALGVRELYRIGGAQALPGPRR